MFINYVNFSRKILYLINEFEVEIFIVSPSKFNQSHF
jgi:hypothetical protein